MWHRILALGPVLGAYACSTPTRVPHDPSGFSRRDPSSLHAHQRDWPERCRSGLLQSPISIASVEFADEAPSPIRAELGVSDVAFVDVGHTLQLRSLTSSASLEFEGTSYAFRQVHFHKPSEHIVDGRQSAMEMHSVFAAPEGRGSPRRALVLGFLIEPGPEHPSPVSFWEHLEWREGYGEDLTERHVWERAMETRELDVLDLHHGEHVLVPRASFSLEALVPRATDFYVYEGSLTTPDCAEGITYAVASTPLFLSEAQIERFEGYYEGNNRDIRPHGSVYERSPRRAYLAR